ncbi:hypothetical protein [Rhodococcus sp. MEB041]|uniref:hypothetical protein n=1 Tax=Rhodococcus sp. MEB041 TaxID=3040323 RepID=UPI00254BE7EB|nr:hypothetical protein [Rhodococcus sp. MEB041]
MNRYDTRTAAVAAISLVLVGCSTTSTASQPDAAVQQPYSMPDLEWSSCPDDVGDPAEEPSRLQCASVPVPIDYDDPDAGQIDVMISRLPSQKPEERRGVLLLNPGGPGGTGLDQPTFLVNRGMPQSVLDSYCRRRTPSVLGRRSEHRLTP